MYNNEQKSQLQTDNNQKLILTCNTGEVIMYFSRNALGAKSYDRQVDKCCKIDSTECLGCCLVILRYFCNGLDKVGNMAWAASYDSIGFLSLAGKEKKW